MLRKISDFFLQILFKMFFVLSMKKQIKENLKPKQAEH